jgi:hypoxanthine phosphoribosyltransferase
VHVRRFRDMEHVPYAWRPMPSGTIERVRGLADVDVVYDAEVIAARVEGLGQEIADHYTDGDLLVLGLLKGSFIFMADLVRMIPRHHQLEFIVAASYGKGTTSSGHVRLLYDPQTVLEDKHVLLVEDIIDSGATLNRLVRLLATRDPKSLEICTLLHKRRADALEHEPRFVGFHAPPEFLVGYGLDFAEDYRHLPFVGSLRD